jgi:hypothetical protein
MREFSTVLGVKAGDQFFVEKKRIRPNFQRGDRQQQPLEPLAVALKKEIRNCRQQLRGSRGLHA